MNKYHIEAVAHNDDRGYRVHLPRPLPVASFAARYTEVVADPRPICHIGIESTGYLLAGIGIIGRASAGHSSDSLVGINVEEPEYFDPAPNYPVLVDNSVHSGETLARAVGYLHRRFIFPATLVTLFDYNDPQEKAVQDWITRELGMQVVSMFSHSDLSDGNHDIQIR